MKRNILKYILPVCVVSVLQLVSCFDMYNEIWDNTGDKYRLAIAETESNNTILKTFNSNGEIDKSFTIVTSAASLIKSAFADFNNDGKVDIFSLKSSFTEQPQISFGDGKGNFPATYLLPSSIQNTDIAVADFDNNGYPDIYIARSGGGDIYYLNYNKSGFTAPLTSNVGIVPLTIAAGDLDGDGDIDLFAGNDTINQVWLNNGDAVLSLSWSDGLTPGSRDSAIFDADNDGDLDILVVTDNYAPAFRLYRNNGSGNFSSGWSYPVVLSSVSVATGDFDNDGDIDAFVTMSAGGGYSNKILYNDGSGNFTVTDSPEPSIVISNDTAAGDIDQDGDLDIILTNDNNELRILKNNGAGIFTLWKTYPSASGARITLGAIFR